MEAGCARQELTRMPEPVVIPSVAELKSFVGQKFGSSDWVTISQQQIQAFADATGDQQWIHVDVERARLESPFRGPIAHGYLTVALAPVLLPQVVRVDGVRMAVNYGLEKLRLPAPVPSGARLRLAAELKHVREMPRGGARATWGLSFEVEGGDKPACVADAIYVYFP
jgi:acyl dehydratase